MAATAALETAELLETILLQLPARDVFIDQRVAKSWRSLICQSPNIQQALFLKPVIKDMSDIPPSVTTVTLDTPCMDILALPGRKVVFQDVLSLREDNGIVTDFDNFAQGSKMGLEKASWRNMLLYQPPVTRALFVTNHHNSEVAYAEWIREFGGDVEIEAVCGSALTSVALGWCSAVTVEEESFVKLTTFVKAVKKDIQRRTVTNLRAKHYRLAWRDLDGTGAGRQFREEFFAALAPAFPSHLRTRRLPPIIR